MRKLIAALAVIASCTTPCPAAAGDGGLIENDKFWFAADSVPILSQGGGIFRFTDPATGKERYYWYGVRYRESRDYLADPSYTHQTVWFEAVSCYSSDNLTDWRYEGDVLDRAELERNIGTRSTWVGRMGVARIDATGQYALFIQHAAHGSDNAVLVAVADAPAGKFRWHDWFSMKERIGTHNTGDQTVFTDPDTGKSYLVYSYGRGRNKIYLSEIGVKDGKVGLLDCHMIYRGAGREGNCMFKYKGKYYMCASDLYGWDGSHAYWLVADSIYGPYTPADSMEVMEGCAADYAHVSQTGFFVTVRGTKQETVVYCGDRWASFAGNGLGYNQWVPLSFSDGRPVFNSLSAWHLDAQTGKWSVADGNNYIRNGSFEADRRPVPNPVKPRQDWLSGWTTEIVAGTPLSYDRAASPMLNYMNSRDDRRHVVGEKSLSMSDSVAFERRVTQTVEATPYVDLPDGVYTLRLMARGAEGSGRLAVACRSGNREVKLLMNTAAMRQWTQLELPRVEISGGKAVVEFVVKSAEGCRLYIDDVTLTRAAEWEMQE